MSKQAPDSFTYQGTKYEIVALSESMESFDPEAYGITPEMMSTACYRGFRCIYAITENGVFLENLVINSENNRYPKIAGVRAKRILPLWLRIWWRNGPRLYKGVNLKIPYSGKILLGREIVKGYVYDLYESYHKPWAYTILTEFVFEQDRLIATYDHSQTAAKIRDILSRDKELENRARHTFSECGLFRKHGIDTWWI